MKISSDPSRKILRKNEKKNISFSFSAIFPSLLGQNLLISLMVKKEILIIAGKAIKYK